MNTDRLKQLSSHLRSLPTEKWDFDRFVDSCGTAGCALGHCPDLWPDTWRIGGSNNAYYLVGPSGARDVTKDAEEFFDLTTSETYKLFFWRAIHSTYVSATMVADRIDKLLEMK